MAIFKGSHFSKAHHFGYPAVSFWGVGGVMIFPVIWGLESQLEGTRKKPTWSIMKSNNVIVFNAQISVLERSDRKNGLFGKRGSQQPTEDLRMR